jgi:hypothetical protein
MRKFLITMLLALSISFLFTGISRAENWIYGGVCTCNINGVNYQTSTWWWAVGSIVNNPDGTIRIEVGYVWTDFGRAKFNKSSNIKSTVNFADYNMTYRITREYCTQDVDFSDYRYPLVFYPNGVNWLTVMPNTVDEALYNLCKSY